MKYLSSKADIDVRDNCETIDYMLVPSIIQQPLVTRDKCLDRIFKFGSRRVARLISRASYFLLLTIFLVGISCGSAPAPDKTVYSNVSNKELKQKTLQLVKSIRDLVDSYNKKDRALMAEYDKKNTPEIR